MPATCDKKSLRTLHSAAWNILEIEMAAGLRVERHSDGHPAFDCFTTVKLRSEQKEAGAVFPAGACGVIVDVYDDGTYGVEFSSPAEEVVIIKSEYLELA